MNPKDNPTDEASATMPMPVRPSRTVHVALVIQGAVETFDSEGRLIETRPIQTIQLAGLSESALGAALGELAGQLGALWGDP